MQTAFFESCIEPDFVHADLLDSNPDDLVLPSTLLQPQQHVAVQASWPDASYPSASADQACFWGPCIEHAD